MDARVDYASPEWLDAWLHHPVVGDPSFDTFVRRTGNPVVAGRPPYEWTVNGSLFIDPPTGDWYLYVGLYPRGYWPPGGCQCLVSHDRGRTWTDLGLVLQGSHDTFDGDGKKPGGMPDVSVCYADGVYHMVYDWATPDNRRGGIAYAHAEHPAGPFVRFPSPIHLDAEEQPILGRYVRMYGATLFRRKRDWLILAMMSTPGNAGGTWALAGMTASNAEGPYTPPTLLLYPQSRRFHPAPVEFFPGFAYEGIVYAPATSVARNRSYQVLYGAPREEAHEPDAWQVVQLGSCWHDEPVPHEARGIWGQTFAAAIDDAGTMHVMFPSKTASDIGTINLAARPWAKPHQQGFVVSGPNAPSLGLLLRTFERVAIETEVSASGPAALLWGHTAPIGPSYMFGAEATAHALTLADSFRWEVTSQGWSLTQVDAGGNTTALASGSEAGQYGKSLALSMEHSRDDLVLRLGGKSVWRGRVSVKRGRVGVLAEEGSIVKVGSFSVSPAGQVDPVFLLATDATMGSGASRKDWRRLESSPMYRFGIGCRAASATPGAASATPGAMAKWNYRGRGFRVWSPRGPDLGRCRIIVDGTERGVYNLHAPSPEESFVIAEDLSLPDGFHAVTLLQEEGIIVCDALEFWPSCELMEFAGR